MNDKKKEVTMITTCEITSIANLTEDDIAGLLENKEAVEKQVKKQIESDLNADDVKILSNKIFIHDIEDLTE